MRHELTGAHASEGNTQPKTDRDDTVAKTPVKRRRTVEEEAPAEPGRTPRRSPDAEGGQPVDELDVDGDGARPV